jgi:hypothetical protein
MQQRLDHYTKVDPLSGCHIWQRSTKPNGYGQLTFRMRRLPLDFKGGRWPSALPADVAEADLALVRLFIGDREYVGRVVVRPFDPMRTERPRLRKRAC